MSTVIIEVDNREKKVFSELVVQGKNFTVDIKEKVLDIGDFHIIIDKHIQHIIERKTCSDLLSSLVDGRYKEQSFRLNEHPLENKDIYYLIETDRLSNDQRIISCVYSLNKKCFSVFRTRDVKDTAFFLLCLAKKALKEASIVTNKTSVSYISTIKPQKKKLDNLYVTVCLYSALPKISVKTAEALQKQYSCVEVLIQALRRNDESIQNLKVNGRRISNAVVDSLRNYLLMQEFTKVTEVDDEMNEEKNNLLKI